MAGEIKKLSAAVLLLITIAIVAVSWHMFSSGPRTLTKLENIDGIPFVHDEEGIHITEKLAHADIDLKEPVLAKQLTLNLEFDPQDAQEISLGIRENPFWLSYQRKIIYSATANPFPPDKGGIRGVSVTIPLTDKLQEPDQSIDLMIFTDYDGDPDAGLNDQTDWLLKNITAEVSYTTPSKAELKDFLRAVIKRETAQ